MTHDRQFIAQAVSRSGHAETIDHATALAICREVGERMRQALALEERQTDRLPQQLVKLISRLRELDDAPPVAPH